MDRVKVLSDDLRALETQKEAETEEFQTQVRPQLVISLPSTLTLCFL